MCKAPHTHYLLSLFELLLNGQGQVLQGREGIRESEQNECWGYRWVSADMS